jgi:hypothetical protein
MPLNSEQAHGGDALKKHRGFRLGNCTVRMLCLAWAGSYLGHDV